MHYPFNEYRIVAVTDRRIVVLDAGRWTMKKARGMVDILPRATRLGPATGVWHLIEFPRAGSGYTAASTRTWKPQT